MKMFAALRPWCHYNYIRACTSAGVRYAENPDALPSPVAESILVAMSFPCWGTEGAGGL